MQIADVAYMEQVKNAIGQDDLVAVRAPLPYQFAELGKRQNLDLLLRLRQISPPLRP
jgi:hypothetical protein